MTTSAKRVKIEKNHRISLETSAQTAADFLVRHGNEAVPIKANFPRGYIRTIVSLRPRWGYLTPARQRTLACVIQLCDVNRFHMNTWHLNLTAGAMWEWYCTTPVVALIEALLYEVGLQENWISKKETFNNCIEIFHQKGIYSDERKEKLHQLRKFRNEVHFHLKENVEMHDGKPQRYNEAVKLLHAIEGDLAIYFKVNSSAKSKA